jgi:hypothetical protein
LIKGLGLSRYTGRTYRREADGGVTLGFKRQEAKSIEPVQPPVTFHKLPRPAVMDRRPLSDWSLIDLDGPPTVYGHVL